MNEDLRVVFESRNRQSCADRALVLTSIQIPHQLIDDGGSCAIVVPAPYSAQASSELQLYDEENPPVASKPVQRIEYQDAMPGLIGYVLIICMVAGMAGYSFFQSNWFVAGRVDGELIRNGEVWRLFTALTLHSGIKHLLGNIVFGVFFGLFAGRLLGSEYTAAGSSPPRHRRIDGGICGSGYRRRLCLVRPVDVSEPESLVESIRPHRRRSRTTHVHRHRW